MKKGTNIVIYVGVFLLAFQLIVGIVYLQSSEKDEEYEGKVVKKEKVDRVKSIKAGNFQTISVVPFPTRAIDGYVVTLEDDKGTNKVKVRKKVYDQLFVGMNMKYKRTFLGKGYDFELSEQENE